MAHDDTGHVDQHYPDWPEEYLEECKRRPNSAERLMSCLRGADITPMRTAAINDFLRDVAVLIDEHKVQ